MNYNHCLALLKYLPEYMIKSISFKLDFDIKNNNIDSLIKEFNYSKKERKSNRDIYDKCEKFKKITSTSLKYFAKNYLKIIKKDFDKVENKLDYFSLQKQLLIDFLHHDLINKSQFFHYTYQIILQLKLDAFEYPSNIQEMMFNYQYYNTLIKLYSKKGNDIQIKYLYEKKDESITMIINMHGFNDIYAYFIKVDSTSLYMNLYEIYIPKHNLIMHSINPNIKQLLKSNRIFSNDMMVSKADKYVNTKY